CAAWISPPAMFRCFSECCVRSCGSAAKATEGSSSRHSLDGDLLPSAAPGFPLRVLARENQGHIRYMPLLIHLQIRLGFSQPFKNAFLFHAIQEKIRLVRIERLAFLERPDAQHLV